LGFTVVYPTAPHQVYECSLGQTLDIRVDRVGTLALVGELAQARHENEVPRLGPNDVSLDHPVLLREGKQIAEFEARVSAPWENGAPGSGAQKIGSGSQPNCTTCQPIFAAEPTASKRHLRYSIVVPAKEIGDPSLNPYTESAVG